MRRGIGVGSFRGGDSTGIRFWAGVPLSMSDGPRGIADGTGGYARRFGIGLLRRAVLRLGLDRGFGLSSFGVALMTSIHFRLIHFAKCEIDLGYGRSRSSGRVPLAILPIVGPISVSITCLYDGEGTIAITCVQSRKKLASPINQLAA